MAGDATGVKVNLPLGPLRFHAVAARQGRLLPPVALHGRTRGAVEVHLWRSARYGVGQGPDHGQPSSPSSTSTHRPQHRAPALAQGAPAPPAPGGKYAPYASRSFPTMRQAPMAPASCLAPHRTLDGRCTRREHQPVADCAARSVMTFSTGQKQDRVRTWAVVQSCMHRRLRMLRLETGLMRASVRASCLEANECNVSCVLSFVCNEQAAV